MSKGFASNYRVSLLAGIILAFFGGLVARLAWLQAIDRPHLLTFIEKARHAVIPEYARRGDIVDANNQLLATSVSLVQVWVDPREVHTQESGKWRELAQLLDMPLEEVQKTLTTQFKALAPSSAGAAPGRVFNSKANPAFKLVLPDLGASATAEPAQPVEFAADIAEMDAGPSANAVADAGAGDESDPEPEEADEPDSTGQQRIKYAKLKQVPAAVYAQIEKLKVAGVHGDTVYRREYPQNALAAHLIGYVNHEQQPVAGMEKYANFFLRGQNGWIETEKDGHGHEVARFRRREVPPADGYNLKLSIDTTVQQMAEAELEIIRQKFRPRKATIIVSDPRTGFILALANTPSFDLNHYNSVPKEERAAMQNVAISSLYEPGSVFKIVAASGALEEGLVTPETLIDCNVDRIVYDGDKLYPAGKPRPLLRDDKDDHFDAPIPVWRVLAKSSNRGAVQLAMRLGDERFYKYVQAFGFSLPTGFPVGGEPGAAALRRNAPPPSKWDGLTITRMPAGYSIAVTPLQMHQAMSVIASGGFLLKPQIIQEVYENSGEGVYHYDRLEERRVISAATARTMAGLLRRVATKEGTAESAQIVLGGVDYQVAGKTGTAQKPLAVKLPDGRVVLKGYSTHNHVGSFVGFFPASDPQIEISVIVDDADERFMGKTAYGTLVAAPSFKHLGEELISYRSIRPPTSPAPSVRTMVAVEGGRR